MKEPKKISRAPVEVKSDKGTVSDPPDKKKKYRISLTNTDDIKRLLSITVNELRREEINVQVARATIYAAQVLLNVYSQVDLEERIQKLESLSGYGGR